MLVHAVSLPDSSPSRDVGNLWGATGMPGCCQPFLARYQVRVDSSEDAHLYETVPVVGGSPILRDLLFSPDHRHIYLLSEKQVGPHGGRVQVGIWAGTDWH